jgi:sporulation protein YlmC with PRC-barrel domain
MRIEIGQPVYANDGKRIGRVDRVVLNPATEHVDQLVIHEGVLSADRLVDRTLVADADADGVRLTVDAKAADTLPEFSLDRYPVVSPASADGLGGFAPIESSTQLYVTPAPGETDTRWLGASFDLGPPPEPTERTTSLPWGDVQFDRGADVVDVDGQPVGKVHDLYFDAVGAVTGLLVHTGHVRHRDVAVPLEWIAGVDDDRVRLNISAAEAIDRGAMSK